MTASAWELHPAPINVKGMIVDFLWRIVRAGRFSPAELAVATVIGLHINERGVAFPSLTRIGELSGIKDRRTVTRAIEAIVGADHLSVTKARGRPNQYQAVPEAVANSIIAEYQTLRERRATTVEVGASSVPGSPKVGAMDAPSGAEALGTSDATSSTQCTYIGCTPNSIANTGTIHHNHSSRRQSEELPGLNGSTSTLVKDLAGWINPILPDQSQALPILASLLPDNPVAAVLQGHLDFKEDWGAGKMRGRFSQKQYRNYVQRAGVNLKAHEGRAADAAKLAARKLKEELRGPKQW